MEHKIYLVMKNYFIFLGLLFFGLNSCSKDDFESTLPVDNKILENSIKDEKSVLIEKFGFSFMSSIKQSPNLRKLIKDEALKMFDKDYEVLIFSIKDVVLETGETFETIINRNAKDGFELLNLLKIEPTLTILVPELPLGSFSAKTWDIINEIPAIAIGSNASNEIQMITPENELVIIPNDAIPGFPVLVIKKNERVVSNLEYSDFEKLKSKTVLEKNGIDFKFWSNNFDNINKNNEVKSTTLFLDQKLIDAYTIYEQQYVGLNGWQRDYIYYDIDPSNPNGAFKYTFQEHLTSFGMLGDAINAYNKISDQTGDPFFNNNNRINTSHWTDGYYEFKVRTIVNSTNGLGGEIIGGFTVVPDDLFSLVYETYTTGLWIWQKTWYRLVSISNKTVSVNVPIINWNLDEFSSSIKIEIEEVDLATTTITTDSRVVKFATNFEFSPSIGEKVKVGLKFGASLETTLTNIVQKSFTQGNDPLGEVIVNFADKVVLGQSGGILKRWTTRNYSTGNCTFCIMPKRVQ